MRLWEQRPRRSTRSRSTTISLFSIDLGSNGAYFYDGEVMEFALIALRSSLAAMANDSYGARILRSLPMANPNNFPCFGCNCRRWLLSLPADRFDVTS